MKKILFWSAAVLLAAVSCNKELETAPVSEGDTVSFIATVDGGETELDSKTVLGGDRTPMWSGWELITILDGTNRFIFSTNAETPSNTSVFSYSGETKPTDKVLAVYPSDNTFADDKKYSANIETKTVSGISIPNVQYLTDGTYQVDAAVAAAYSEDNGLKFKNATTLIAFSVGEENVKSGAFYGNTNADNINVGKISGTFDLQISDAGLPVLTAVAPNHWVDFKLSGDASLVPGKTYYIAIAPGEMAEGFTFTLDGKIVASYDKAFTFERNVIYGMGELKFPEKKWGIVGDVNNWGGTTENPVEDVPFEKYSEGLFVARSVTFPAGGFKIRSNNTWNNDDNYGFAVAHSVDLGYYYELIASGSSKNIMVSDITCDIWFNLAEKRLYVMAPGQDISEAKEYITGVPTAKDGYFFFKPTADWMSAGARFAAYFYNNANGTNDWVGMNAVEDCPGYYECEILSGYPNVIFCRMNPGTTDNNWGNKWNQSADLSVPTNGENLFVLRGGGWDGQSGDWSTL